MRVNAIALSWSINWSRSLTIGSNNCLLIGPNWPARQLVSAASSANTNINGPVERSVRVVGVHARKPLTARRHFLTALNGFYRFHVKIRNQVTLLSDAMRNARYPGRYI